MNETAVSLLMCVGEQYYKFHEFVDEAQVQGISKRIPLKGIPQGLVKYKSKIFVAHPKAILKVTTEGKTLHGLGFDLLTLGVLPEEQWHEMVDLDAPYWTGTELSSQDIVPNCMYNIAYAFSKLDDRMSRRLVEEYGIEFCMGIFGYALFTGFELVLDRNEHDVPNDMKDMADLIESGYVEMVHVDYGRGKDGNQADRE